MLNLYVGSSAAAEIVGPASNYVRIRALAMPIALLSNALQAALLGSKDSMTPLIALGFAAVLNCFGDVLLVVGARLGLAGAAIATVASQVAGLLLLLKASKKTLPMAESKAATPEARKAASKRFLAFCPPVLLVVIGKMATFGFMTHVASCLSPENMAAHQIALSTFFLLGETSAHFFPFLTNKCSLKC
jgi:Na+-driven multidrug efflux pump